ncbi:MAG: phosphotransferase [Ktedonobacterales bacterium]
MPKKSVQADIARDEIDEADIVRELAGRLRGATPTLDVERVQEGVSTRVYRIRQHRGRRDDTTLYLRILPEANASFASEVLAHTQLKARGVAVPDVVYWEPCHPTLDRSIMLTTAIPGASLASSWRELKRQDRQRILHAAGRDLAVINRLPVAGFGWIRRDDPAPTGLIAEHSGPNAAHVFLHEYLDHDLRLLEAHGLSAAECQAIRDVIGDQAVLLDRRQAYLAHGDFDVTHIYQQQGVYTGVIDFGEIRGADAFYDLGHFRQHDGETIPSLLLADLMAGYTEVAPLPVNASQRIHLLSLLIGVRTVGRFLSKHGSMSESDRSAHFAWQGIRREIAAFAAL